MRRVGKHATEHLHAAREAAQLGALNGKKKLKEQPERSAVCFL